MKKIFIAMAESEDGDRVFGNAYTAYQQAHTAAVEMIEDIETNMDWQMVPSVEEIDFVED